MFVEFKNSFLVFCKNSRTFLRTVIDSRNVTLATRDDLFIYQVFNIDERLIPRSVKEKFLDFADIQ